MIVLDSCTSTNSALPADAPHGEAVMALEQTAGRGQRGNHWEAEPGLNVTMSVMLRPQGLEARRQFEVSEAVALAVVDLLDTLGVADVAVKWPNDIYVGDRKICGILIENALEGCMIARSIAGVGLNVNQRMFRSDAPNPVSLWQLQGREYDIRALAEELVQRMVRLLGEGNLHARYISRLWRGKGLWQWQLPSGELFEAEVADVLPTGHLCLRSATDVRTFAFKEVSPVM